MDTEALREFLIESNKQGYAAGKEITTEPDGSHAIFFAKGDWKSHDNFFGGEPYGGRIAVSYKGKSVWIMVYYGRVIENENPNAIYAVLRNALMRMPEEHPFRGPEKYAKGNLAYTNSWTGVLEKFSGEEQITRDGKVIYEARYMGGLVDQREGI
ncbi:MAG: hypothetical protein HY482_02585 [Candidatus Wildermuthbacteria bacterium]|nr:hypothetical protein [Candidatus Wildermuthbacteria bacterium]